MIIKLAFKLAIIFDAIITVGLVKYAKYTKYTKFSIIIKLIIVT